MNNSFIIGFFIRLCALLRSWYENSIFKKCTEGIVRFIKKITANSFFVNYFSSPFKEACLSTGKILKSLGRVVAWFRRILSKAAEPVKKSAIVNLCGEFYSKLLFCSLRIYAVGAIISIIVYSVFALLGGAMTNTMSVTAVVALFLCSILFYADTSVYNLFGSSILVKLFGRFLGNESFTPAPVIKLNHTNMFIAACAGVIIALLSLLSNPLLALVVLFGAAAAGWILYDYSVGIYIAVVLLPFAPTMALVALIMFTFASFMLRFVFDDEMTFTRTPVDIPIMLFAAVLIVSAVTSFDVKSSVMATLVYIAFILSYFLLTNSIKSRKRLFSLVSLVLLAGLFVAAYGIYQHIFGFAEGTVWTDTDMFSDIETRVVSTFENPNVLGEYLLLLIPIGLGIVWGAKQGYNKLIHLAIVGALSLCMIYTYSRGNWIGLLVAVFLFFMFYDRRFVWLGLVALLISPVFLPQNVINRFLSVGDMGDTSTSYRVYIWMGTLKMLKDYWFSGIGIGTQAFNRIYPLYAFSGVIAPHSHNLYLQIIVENGIAGILVFLSIMVAYYKMCISQIIITKDRLLKGIITGLAAGMFGYLVQGMFDNVWYNYRVFLLFFVILGITAACVNISKKTALEENNI